MQSSSPPYDPTNPWKFPPQRLVEVFTPLARELDDLRTKWQNQYSMPDLRFVVFHELFGVVKTAQSWAVLMRDHTAHLDWWEAHPDLEVKAHPKVMAMLNMGMREMIQTSVLENLALKWLDAMLQTGRALNLPSPNDGAWDSKAEAVAAELLAELELFEWIGLIPLIKACRNTAFFAGKFCDPQGENVALAYRGQHFFFLHKGEVSRPSGFVDDWDLLVFIVLEMALCLDAVFQTEPVAAQVKIATSHLD